MPEFFNYPQETPPLTGTEIILGLAAGQTKRFTSQDIVNLGAPAGPTGPVGAPGGGWFARYTFSTNTSNADPGNGQLRLSSATQNAATTIRADLLGNDGVDVTTLLDLLDDSTSTIKGTIRLYLETDATKYLVFQVTALAAPSGYRNITVTPVAWSASVPFANGDHVILTFTATGDLGQQGIQGIQGFTGNVGDAISYLFDTTTTASDPGSGKLRLNNATPASVTAIYADDLSAAGIDLSAFLATLDDSTSTQKGYFILSNLDFSKFHVYAFTAAITHVATYSTIAVTYVAGAGAFSNGEAVFLSGKRTGDLGQQGIQGIQGITGNTGALGGALPFLFDTTTTASDPGSGKLRFNNASGAAATALYVDDLTTAAVDISAFLGVLDDSTNTVKGYFLLSNADESKFYIFSFSVVITHTATYSTATVVYVAGSGTFTNGEAVYLSGFRVGDQGATGSTGSTGPAGAASSGVMPYTYDTTTTASDPGSGKVRLNNAAPASATAMYIDDLTNVAVDVSAYLVYLGSSSAPIKGIVELCNADKSKTRIYTITAAISHITAAGATYCQITLSYLTGSGTFTNGEAVFVGITRRPDEPFQITQAAYAALSPPTPGVWYVVIP